MWTDEQGVAHISDQSPPKGVEAKSFSMERGYSEVDVGKAEAHEQAGSQPMESTSMKKDQNGHSDSTQSDSSRQGPPKAHKLEYRDEASLSSDDKLRLLLLEASREHANKLYDTASSEDERRR